MCHGCTAICVACLGTCWYLFKLFFDRIGWEATEQHAVITTAAPVLFYVTFFVARAQNTYIEIQEEEEQEAKKQDNKSGKGKI